MKVFIVIVTYNSMKWIEKCLESIPKNYPIIIVDNNSTDNTVSYIKGEKSTIVLIEEKENLGFGKANNIGVSYALTQGAEHVFLLNQDAYLIDNCLEVLIQFQNKFPEYGILSPVHINSKKDKLDKKFTSHICYQGSYEFISDHVLNNNIKPIYSVNFVNAAGWLLSKKILDTIGGFDPIFFHYGEDDNFCQRALYHNFKIGVSPNALMIHDRQERNEVPAVNYSNEYFEKKERYYKVEFANVKDEAALVKMDMRLNSLRNMMIRSIFKLNSKRFNNVKRELKLLLQVKKAIEHSYYSNRKKTSNYLSY